MLTSYIAMNSLSIEGDKSSTNIRLKGGSVNEDDSSNKPDIKINIIKDELTWGTVSILKH